MTLTTTPYENHNGERLAVCPACNGEGIGFIGTKIETHKKTGEKREVKKRMNASVAKRSRDWSIITRKCPCCGGAGMVEVGK